MVQPPPPPSAADCRLRQLSLTHHLWSHQPPPEQANQSYREPGVRRDLRTPPGGLVTRPCRVPIFADHDPQATLPFHTGSRHFGVSRVLLLDGLRSLCQIPRQSLRFLGMHAPHCARTFEGHSWVTYDRLYCCQAAASHSLCWATEDQTLYNEAFTGRAKPVA